MYRRNLLSSSLLFFFLSLLSQQAKLILPVASTNELKDVKVSTDEKFAVSADLDGTIKFWEVATGRLFQTFHHPNGYSIAISHDNRYVISGGLDYTIKIWDVESGNLFKTMEENVGAVSEIAVSPDGKWLVVGNQEAEVFLWETVNWKLVHKYKAGGMVNDIQFSHDGTWFATASNEKIHTWSFTNETPKNILIGHQSKVHSIQISSNDKWLASSSWDHTARLWNLETSKTEMIFKGHTESVFDIKFSPDQKSLVTASNDNTIKFWDISTGKNTKTLIGHSGWVTKLRFGLEGNTLISISFDHTAKIWNYPSGELITTLEGHKDDIYFIYVLSKTNKLVLGSYDNDISLWSLVSGKLDFYFGLHNETICSITISNDRKKALTTYRDGRLKIIDLQNGSIIRNINAHSNWATSGVFSGDDEIVLSAGTDRRLKKWEVKTGNLLAEVRSNASVIDAGLKYSPGGKYLLSWGNGNLTIFNMITGNVFAQMGGSASVYDEEFSRSDKYLLTYGPKEAKVWNTGDSLILFKKIKLGAFKKKGNTWERKLLFSPDEKYVICLDSVLKLYEINTGKLSKQIGDRYPYVDAWLVPEDSLVLLSGNNFNMYYFDPASAKITGSVKLENQSIREERRDYLRGMVTISKNKKYIASVNYDEGIYLWSLETGKLIGHFSGDNMIFSDESIITTDHGVLKFYSLLSGKEQFSHFVTGESDFIVVDSLGRYDGTEVARKQLYLTCGTEVVELGQVKDQLWVPNLASRILSGDSINAKTLDQLNICGLIPDIQDSSTGDEYRFKIIPKRGGIGETVVLINGIEVKRFKPAELIKNGNNYDLRIKKEDLKNYFIPGKQNPVLVKSFTADNAISSRGSELIEDQTKRESTPPNLFAVMVGVSDYKGDEMDLKYAAKDANDISNAIGNAARKLLNQDGKEHVFMYNLTTAKEHYQLPEKAAIKKILEEIGKKATANDILMIFFAGHGVMEGEKKQFYFLTADASRTTATSALAEVGISTTELTDWMKPENIKAQKRILIFDACNSGQAINDFVKMGSDNQKYVASRGDDKAQQIKAIDKLNEKSGLFILSASASNQSAYELGRYSQGLLTYALLKAIKEQPDILEEGKYLNLSRWFSAAEKTVTEVSRESGARQEPQIVSNSNFNIGLVDEEVIAKIILPAEKPLFASCNFQNADENIADDDLELSKLVNFKLNDLSIRGKESKIVYMNGSNSPDAYSLSGRYALHGDSITVIVNMKQKKVIKYKFEISGTKDKLQELAEAIAEKAVEMVK